ncbi:unnamed protein product [Rotaria socialis]|nr:unnamed protein product [Rotaria socialis]
MDARNYVCDYNFDWVEKVQPYANRLTDGKSQYQSTNQHNNATSPMTRAANKPIDILNDYNEQTCRDRENAHIVASSLPNPEVISDTK